ARILAFLLCGRTVELLGDRAVGVGVVAVTGDALPVGTDDQFQCLVQGLGLLGLSLADVVGEQLGGGFVAGCVVDGRGLGQTFTGVAGGGDGVAGLGQDRVDLGRQPLDVGVVEHIEADVGGFGCLGVVRGVLLIPTGTG